MSIIILFIAIICLLGFFVCFVVSTHNKLVKYRNKVKNAWAHIDAQIQRKFDLIPNLVEVVKGSTEHEKHILENAAKIINNYNLTTSHKEKINIDFELSACLNSLCVVADKNPSLKSDIQFLRLQEALTEIEEDISYARQFYNDAVTIYNNNLMSFPNNVIASCFKFKEEELFDALNNEDITLRIHFKNKCSICGAVIKENDKCCQYCGNLL